MLTMDKWAGGNSSKKSKTNNNALQFVSFEDDEETIKTIMKRRSMALRHVLRTHRVSIDWCFEVFSDPDIHIRYVNTKEQIADMMTKGFQRKILGNIWPP